MEARGDQDHEKTGILLALRAREDGPMCLERAKDLAERFGEALRILCVLPARSSLRGWFAGEPVATTTKDERSVRWLSHLLGNLAERVAVEWRRGEFGREVVAYARRLAPRVVVLGEISRPGDVATQIVRDSGAQVLVTRGKPSANAILAATDLQDVSFPVLRMAAELARALQQPLVTLHNVDPLSMMSGRAALSTGVVLSGGVSAATRRESLVGVSRALNVDPTPVIRTELDPVHAILDEAEVCDASMIVVGAHPRTWWQRLMDESIAARVTNQAKRDVLVAPIGVTVFV